MSSVQQQDPGRMKNPGGGGGGAVREHPGQEFDSWRHQTHQATGFNPISSLASDPYGFYQQSAFHHYQGFGVGEGTWSNGGDHGAMTFLSGYGGQMAGADQGYSGIDTATMFGAGGGFSAFTQPTGYGFDFHTAGFNQWGSAAAGRGAEPYYRTDAYTQQQEQDSRGRLTAAEQAMQGLSMTGGQPIESPKDMMGMISSAGGNSSSRHAAGANNQEAAAALLHHHHHQINKGSSHSTSVASVAAAASMESSNGGPPPSQLPVPSAAQPSSASLNGGPSGGSHSSVNNNSASAPTGTKSSASGAASSSAAGSSGGGSGGGPKKMSWASVASQPAKPAPPANKTKKPGVLVPPVLPGATSSATVVTAAGGGGKPSPTTNMDIGTWDGANGNKQNGQLPPPPHMGVPPPMGNGMLGGGSGQRPGGIMGPIAVGGPGGASGGGFGGRNNNTTWAGAAGQQQQRGGSSNSNSKLPPLATFPSGPGMMMSQNGFGGAVAYVPGGPPPPQQPVLPAHPVLEELRSVNEYNPREYDLNPKNARFFVIKSYSEDDIHRSIKYEIWCSTEHGNRRLDGAWRERDGKGPILLFFSVNGSGHFCGMAQMLSGVDYNSSAGVWAQDKWKGQFKVKWIYVKDVPNSQLRHIRLENNENKPVTNSRDTQEVPPEKGRLVLKILHSFKHSTSIFDDFTHYEKRQEEDEGRRVPPPQAGNRGEQRPHRDDGRNYRGDRGDRGDRGERGGDRGGERSERGGDRSERGGDRGERGGERGERGGERGERGGERGERGGERGERGGERGDRREERENVRREGVESAKPPRNAGGAKK